MAHENHVRPAGHSASLPVHLGHERTRRIEHVQVARVGVLLDRLRNAVRAEDRDGARRHFAEMLDEARALRTQRLDDMTVVDDLVPHVTGGPNCASACSTMSMARITPAQKPRGCARTTRMTSGSRREIMAMVTLVRTDDSPL